MARINPVLSTGRKLTPLLPQSSTLALFSGFSPLYNSSHCLIAMSNIEKAELGSVGSGAHSQQYVSKPVGRKLGNPGPM